MSNLAPWPARGPAPCPPYGRPIKYQYDPGCWHRVRRLGLLVDSLGRHHVIDTCVICGGRTECIACRDVVAEGLDPSELPVLRGRHGEAA